MVKKITKIAAVLFAGAILSLGFVSCGDSEDDFGAKAAKPTFTADTKSITKDDVNAATVSAEVLSGGDIAEVSVDKKISP